MDKSTFSILFIMQKSKPNAEGNAPIFARITINHQMTHLATRYYLPPERWLPKEGRTVGRTKEEKEVNAYLDNLRGLIIAKYNEMFLAGEVVTARKLKCRLISKDEKSMTLLELFDDYIKDYAKLVGHTTSKITHDRYVLTRKRLMEYMEAEYMRSDISVNEVNPKFVNGFEIFLRSQFHLSTNYVMKTILKFKSVYQVAIDNGWAQKNPFANFKFHYEQTEPGYLTMDELTRVMQKAMPSKRLEQIRDVFVFSCFTGLAYCDARALTREHIITGSNGAPWLRTHRQKTSTPVDVPLFDVPLQILAKYEGCSGNDRLLPIPANQKCNDYLKEIAAICGIEKRLTFHLARHTFTTLQIALGTDIYTVSKMLTHKSVKTTQVYADLVNSTKRESANRISLRSGKKIFPTFHYHSPSSSKLGCSKPSLLQSPVETSSQSTQLPLPRLRNRSVSKTLRSQSSPWPESRLSSPSKKSKSPIVNLLSFHIIQ